MRVHTGDWLAIRSYADSTASRRDYCRPVADGQPPYTVRCEDSGHEGVVFPRSDAQLVTGS